MNKLGEPASMDGRPGSESILKLIMKTFYSLSICAVIAFCMVSCGGVIGNIEKYRFSKLTHDSLKAIVASINATNPELKNLDTSKYRDGISGFGDGDYYCRIRKNGEDILLVYAYPKYPPPNDTITEIALISGGPYNGDLPLAKDIGYFKQQHYKHLFRKYFISEVQSRIDRQQGR